jgi:hypothetical protein
MVILKTVYQFYAVKTHCHIVLLYWLHVFITKILSSSFLLLAVLSKMKMSSDGSQPKHTVDEVKYMALL